MPSLYVVEQGAKLSVEQRRLLVHDKAGALITKVPLVHTDAVIIFGHVVLTVPAMKHLMQAGIDVIFLTQHGGYQGRLVGPLTKFGRLRQSQYEQMHNGPLKLAIAQSIIRTKCLNMRTLLMRYNRDLNQAAITTSVERLGWLAECTQRTTRLNTLLGVEGSASAAYFSVFHQLFKRDWPFEKRLRRPPPDPVNVLLSFGYTLLTRELESSIALVGLDPYLGVLHTTEYGRPSLALDLAEEFRAIIVDSVVLRCLNNDLLTPENFTPGTTPERPVILDDAGKRRLIQTFEDRVQTTIQHPVTHETMTYRRVFEIQTRLLARCFRDNQPDYTPFQVR